VVEDTVILGDVPLRLADTAGIHFTEDPVEQIGVTRAREKLNAAQLALVVFDSSQPLNSEDKELIKAIKDTPAVAVINKSDLPAEINNEYIQSKFKHIVYISALSGEGMEELRNAVAELLKTAQLNPADGILYTERQRDDARNALDCVTEALLAVEHGMTLDAVTVSIEGAISALLELTGERATEAVVDEVFSHFCVGK
jgi:tRNA modification GTPase